MGPIWGRQDPGGPHVGLMNLVICYIAGPFSPQDRITHANSIQLTPTMCIEQLMDASDILNNLPMFQLSIQTNKQIFKCKCLSIKMTNIAIQATGLDA